MAWGLYKKMVIADRLAQIVDYSYANIGTQNGLSILFGTCCYSFQIYCDFSGYSDIAIGASRIMGIKLMDNFNSPYFSKSISEFWKRWHISLSTWFRDYLYISLGGNRVAIPRLYLNLFIVFLLSGLWHGANWTFIVWGALHGFYLIFAIEKDKLFRPINFKNRYAEYFYNSIKISTTFLLVTFAWIFFRSPSISIAFDVIKKIAQTTFTDKLLTPFSWQEIVLATTLVCLLLVKEKYASIINTKNSIQFWFVFAATLFVIYLLGVSNQNQFIYFQF